MELELAVQYPGISAQGFAHPADRAATAAIRSVSGLDMVVKLFTEHGYERRVCQLLLGNAVRLDDDQLPGLWAVQRRCAKVLDVDPCPKLYLTQEPVGNGLTIGTKEPLTLVSSGLVSSYSQQELAAVLGHEMGHVLSDHVGLMTTFLLVQMILSGVIRTVPLAGVPLLALYLALLEWSRAAELTSDRASAIVTGEPLVVCGALMRMAGGPVENLRLDAFISQATEYEEEPDAFAALLAVLRRDHDHSPVSGAAGTRADRMGETGGVGPGPFGRLSAKGPGASGLGRIRRGVRALPRALLEDPRTRERRGLCGVRSDHHLVGPERTAAAFRAKKGLRDCRRWRREPGSARGRDTTGSQASVGVVLSGRGGVSSARREAPATARRR